MAVSPGNTYTFNEFERDVLCKIAAYVFMFNLLLLVFIIKEIGKTNML